MKRPRALALLLSFASTLLVGCTGGSTAPTSSATRAPYTGGTITVGMTGSAYTALDPQGEWAFGTWEILRGCLVRTLMSYEPSAGTTGSEPKPDLAIAPPEVSADGSTWTFHLRPGLHYGPPLQDVEISSPDIVRAILRAGDPETANAGIGELYLSNILGYTEYAEGKMDSIAGLQTPDPLTLVITQIRPDSSLTYDLALPTTAPIPPSPIDDSARYGVATGHDRSSDPSKKDGYGRFLVSSGPYMIEGEDAVDFSLPPDQQTPAAGLVPWSYDSDYNVTEAGSITLVRNPSWDPATDPLRAALPEKIVVLGGEPGALFRRFASGELAMVFDDNPPRSMLQEYLADPTLRQHVYTIDSGNIIQANFNVAQPPFDDVAVRRAVAFALDRQELGDVIRRAIFGEIVIANHYTSDVTEDSLAAGWSPFPTPDGSPDLAAARAAIAPSPYAKGGRCVDPVCASVTVVLHADLNAAKTGIVRSLAALGIGAKLIVSDDFDFACSDPKFHAGLCVGNGWFPDTPSPNNTLNFFFGGPEISPDFRSIHLGADRAELARLGSPLREVPSVDAQFAACNKQVGAASIACWTRLDQYLVSELMPAVPLVFQQVVRLSSPQIEGVFWDLGVQEPALDRLVVTSA